MSGLLGEARLVGAVGAEMPKSFTGTMLCHSVLSSIWGTAPSVHGPVVSASV